MQQNTQNQRDNLCVALVGDSGVGKSHLIEVLKGAQGQPSRPTLTIEISVIQNRVNGQRREHNIQVIDIPAKDDLLTMAVFKLDLWIICFDVSAYSARDSRAQLFPYLYNWINKIKEASMGDQNTPILFVGCKLDQIPEQEREDLQRELKKIASSLNNSTQILQENNQNIAVITTTGQTRDELTRHFQIQQLRPRTMVRPRDLRNSSESNFTCLGLCSGSSES